MILFGSVCSGIEAASVAWAQLGWKAAWLSEIEPFPCAVLAHHYPDVPNLGDMTLLPDRIRSGEVIAPDVFCGGTPCQAFSVAGLRKSLDDARGNLSLTFCEIADAIDSKRIVPSIIFWENVPGVLNTKDNAFGCFLGALAGEDDALTPPGGRWSDAGFIDGPQRAIAWRVLDAQYFGVAQRRKRVYVIASARADFDPASVLFEFEGLRRDTAPSREAGQEIAKCLTKGIAQRFDSETETMIPVYGGSDLECADTVTSKWAKGSGGPSGNECGLFVAQPIPIHDQATRHAGKHNNKQDGKGNGLGIGQPGDPMNTLTKGDRHAVAQPIPLDLRNAGRDPEKHDEINRQGVGVGEAGDPSHTITSACVHGVAHPTVLMDQGGNVMNVLQDGTVGTLRRETHGHEPAVMQPPNMAIRRLTPTECERLQGFPDGYTNTPWRKQPEAPDGPRYKALGNSWAVPVITWIGKRIANAIA